MDNHQGAGMRIGQTTRNATIEQFGYLNSAIARGGSGPAMADILYQTAAAFGIRHASLMLMPSSTDLVISTLILESSLPLHFWSSMDEVCPPATCPLFNAARGSITPVLWSADLIRRQSKLVGAPPPAVLDLFHDFQLTSGIVFPISSIDGVRHAIRYDGNREPLSQPEINDLAMLSAYFFQAYDGTRYPGGDRGGLTERELEVVRWSATGKTSGEIARTMALSDHTINAYINNAMKKLDCTSRTQLVAKALRMRIIS
jgi:DNA-binding CsgD family transcriptional regulator